MEVLVQLEDLRDVPVLHLLAGDRLAYSVGCMVYIWYISI